MRPFSRPIGYTTRRFNLKLALSPLAQGDSLSQVADRGSLVTRISKEGQVLTEVSYFVKNRGNPNFRLTLPAGRGTLVGDRERRVRGAGEKRRREPDSAAATRRPERGAKLDLKLASKSKNPKRVIVAAPIVNAPVMLAEWRLEPDAGQRLTFVKGSLTPAAGYADTSGFAQLARMFSGGLTGHGVFLLAAMLVLLLAALILWRWAGAEGVYRFSVRHIGGRCLGWRRSSPRRVALVGLFGLADDHRGFAPKDVSFLAPFNNRAAR